MRKTIIFLCMGILFLSGCSLSPDTPKSILSGTIDAILRQDFESARNTTIFSSYADKFYAAYESADGDELNQKLFDKVSYEVTSEQKESDEVYTYQVRVISPNLQKVFNDVFQQFFMANMNENEEFKSLDEVISDYIPKALDSADLEMKSYDVPVKVQRDKGAWKVNVTKELVDPLTGGMYSLIESSIELSPNE